MPTQIGPENGSLVIVGGGYLSDPQILTRFIALAGGFSAAIVIIPTAYEEDFAGPYTPYHEDFMRVSAQNLTTLHTRDRAIANSAAFVTAIDKAQGVWFMGGRQWRLADAYLHTETHAALERLLARGGVIGGTSAGATILGSYLVRGDTQGNEIMIGDHTEGFGFLKNSAIDQHHLKRNRHFDMQAVIAAHPELLGLGIDEDTALVIRGNEAQVIGRSYVAVYDGHRVGGAGGEFYFLAPGDGYDLAKREVIIHAEAREYAFTGKIERGK